MKQRIRLTENQLHRIIKESVKRILCETTGDLEIVASPKFNNALEFIIQTIGSGTCKMFRNEDGSKTFCLDSDLIDYMKIPNFVINWAKSRSLNPRDILISVKYKGEDILPDIL